MLFFPEVKRKFYLYHNILSIKVGKYPICCAITRKIGRDLSHSVSRALLIHKCLNFCLHKNDNFEWLILHANIAGIIPIATHFNAAHSKFHSGRNDTLSSDMAMTATETAIPVAS